MSEFTARDRYVPRPDVPGHVMRTFEARHPVDGHLGTGVICECGWQSVWTLPSGVTTVENLHRIEVGG